MGFQQSKPAAPAPPASNAGDMATPRRGELHKEIENLKQENARLARQMTLEDLAQVDVEQKKAGIKMTPSELETLRAIFDIYDKQHTGSIATEHVKTLHVKLGEPLTEEEEKSAVKELDPNGRGEVTFDRFLAWWTDRTNMKQTTNGYTARFQLINAKLTENFDLNRIVKKSVGQPNSLEYRVVFQYKQPNGILKPISPWHDIPLTSFGKDLEAKIFNFICEIPKWTRAKFEIATDEPYNPIKQDVQHGKLRFYKYGDMMFNYGCFPRTWEDPHHVPDDTKYPGDNDPLDVLEIGTRQLETGSVTPVKVLGVLALIDDGETDWKIIAISIHDPLAHLLNDIDDVDKEIPGAINAMREYFRVYKVVTGKPENGYALRGEAMPREYAVKVVEQCHEFWENLYNVQKLTTVLKGHHSAAPAANNETNAEAAEKKDS